MMRIANLLEYLLLGSVSIALVFFLGAPPEDSAAQSAPPPHWFEQGNPPWDAHLALPDTSDRVVRYVMNVRLDTTTNTITGTESLDWRNTTGRSQRTFPFHLYHNAWKNNRSTFAKENDWSLGEANMRPEDYGFTNIRRAVWLSRRGETDITESLRFIQPDDGNSDDQTVCELSTPGPILPGETLRLRIEFETKQPVPISRTGAIRSYHFAAQWFPKIGVWWKDGWNCHQFHSSTEFFADYGSYDVTITVPGAYVVGASGGVARSLTANADGTTSHRFMENDIHDFAWVAAPGLTATVRRFRHAAIEPDERSDRHHPLKEVDVILLTQPHHEAMIERYFDATFKALRYYGEWYGEYPYNAVTVVDPANGSSSGGMEYPTLFTGGTTMFSPRAVSSPEGVTVHEFGHQFWYALVGNNEFEEAWLDEGFTTYSTDRVLRYGWLPFKAVRSYFGGPGAGTYVGLPWVFSGIDEMGLDADNTMLRRGGSNDVMARRGWEYNQSYGLNSYNKPAMSLMMLERTLGEETMYRVLRTYHHRFRFKHPTSEDFIRTVNEVTGNDYRWFFDNTWFSSDLFDYAIDRINNMPIPPPEGVFTVNGTPIDSAQRPRTNAAFLCEVIVKREGEAIAPVELMVTFAGGETKYERWDGAYRWKKFSYLSDKPIVKAVVDPDHKLVMDVNWNNNSRVVRPANYRSLAARKYASAVLFWVQNYLELMSL